MQEIRAMVTARCSIGLIILAAAGLVLAGCGTIEVDVVGEPTAPHLFEFLLRLAAAFRPDTCGLPAESSVTSHGVLSRRTG